MPLYIKGTDIEIIGVLEEVRGNAAAFSLCDDGSIEYAGGTTFFYNEQKMVLASNGQPIWLDEDGAEYPGAEVEDRREDGTVVSWHRLEQDIEDDLYDALDDLAKMKVRLERVRARNDKFRSFQAHVTVKATGEDGEQWILNALDGRCVHRRAFVTFEPNTLW